MSRHPYPGLRPFERRESDIFFGREEHIGRLLEKLGQTFFVAVIGPSGFGKSSLVKAGLIPTLEMGLLAGAGVDWHIIELSPGNRPFARLAETLVRKQSPEAQNISHPEHSSTKEALTNLPTLKRCSLGLKEYLDEAPLPKGTNLLLLVDRFEEIFRYQQEAPDETTAFVALLIESAKQNKWPIYVVITLTPDYLSDCTKYPNLPAAINDGQFLIPRLTHKELSNVIGEPAHVYNGKVEPGLINRLLNDTDTQPDQLLLIQHTLKYLWNLASETDSSGKKALTLDNYNRMGGYKEAASLHADKILNEFSDTQRALAERLFRTLCKCGGSQTTRRPTKFEEIKKILEVSEKDLTEVIEPFRKPEYNILTPPLPIPLDSGTTLDISYESLIHRWKTLQGWVEKETKSAKVYLRLEETALLWEEGKAGLWGSTDLDTALEWKENERPTTAWVQRYGQHFDIASEFLKKSKSDRKARLKEKEQAVKRKRKVRIIAFSIMLFLSIWALWERNKTKETSNRIALAYKQASKQKTIAEQAKLEANVQKNIAEDTAKLAEEQKRLVQQAIKESEEQKIIAEKATRQEKKQRLQAEQAVNKAEEQKRLARQATKQAEEQKAIAEKAAKEAIKAQLKAERAELQRTAGLFDAQLTHAGLLARVEDYTTARSVLAESVRLDPNISIERKHARNLLAGYVDIMSGTADKIYRGAGAALTGGVAAGPDGKWLAAAGERNTLVLFDAKSGKPVKRLKVYKPDGSASEGAVFSIVFAPKGNWLAGGGIDRRIIRWSIPDGKKLDEWQAPDKVYSLAISPDGTILAGGGTGNDITLWNANNGEKLRTLKGHTALISERDGLAFSPGGQLLASASYDKTARIWDVNTGETMHHLKWHNGSVHSVAFSPDGRLLSTSSSDKRIVIWRVSDGQPIRLLRGHQNTVFGTTFDTQGKQLISASRDNTLRIWDIQSGTTQRILQGHEAAVSGVARHGSTLYSAGNDGTLRRWPPAENGKWIWEMPAVTPTSTAIAPKLSILFIGFKDGALRVFSLPEGNPIFENTEVHDEDIARLALNKDETLLASAGYDNTAKLWRIKQVNGSITLELVHVLTGHNRAVHAVSFSPDGKTIATASYDGRVGLFSTNDGQGKFFEAHDGEDVNTVHFNQDGTSLLTVSDYGMRIWDATTNPPILGIELPKAVDTLLWACFSPDGRLVAAVGREQVVSLYTVESATKVSLHNIRRLVGHEQAVFRAIFSPDSRQLATIGDNTVRLWDIGNDKELFKITLAIGDERDPYWDFDFRFTPRGDCWIAVPLTRGRLALYRLPYSFPPPSITTHTPQ